MCLPASHNTVWSGTAGRRGVDDGDGCGSLVVQLLSSESREVRASTGCCCWLWAAAAPAIIRILLVADDGCWLCALCVLGPKWSSS